MIFSNTADLQQYVTVNDRFNFERFQPYVTKAVNSFTNRYVGKLHVELEQAESGDDSIKNEAREHLKAALANFAMFLYLPYMQVQMESTGINVAQNENRKSAEWWQVNDIRRDYLRAGHEAMDLLLEVLEKNSELFTDYATNYSSQYKELLVKNADEFDRWYNIFRSRQTYLAIVPAMRMIETQIFKNSIADDFLKDLKSFNPDDSHTEEQAAAIEAKAKIKDYLQQAVVSFTIAKIYHEGMFHFDASGVKLKFDVLPNEKVQAIDYGKAADQLQRAIKSNIDNGTQFMLLAKELIEEFFPDGLSTQESVKATVIGNAGIIGI
jgi:hypothetical protein